MLLKDAKGVIERLEEVLLVTYPRLELKLIDHLKESMAHWEAHIVEAAVQRHIQDTRTNYRGEPHGQYAPTLAQILLHAEQLQSQNTPPPLPPEPEPEDGRYRWLELPPEAAVILGRKRIRIDSWRSACVECSDRGLARFYHDPKNTRRVWLFSEWLELPEAMRRGLRCASAVCDCEKGRFHEHRQSTTTLWFKGKEHEAPVWPRLEYIRKLAQRRKREDLMAVGAA